ncbi:hypothetical protein CP533_2346 [Ophiocordyceps camponoti-saundersi (nom. inval.)]|nr:hypothetical protein CP533_2346 [Ophiocordyceps camponoti-saundersi (nom. inval.)]
MATRPLHTTNPSLSSITSQAKPRTGLRTTAKSPAAASGAARSNARTWRRLDKGALTVDTDITVAADAAGETADEGTDEEATGGVTGRNLSLPQLTGSSFLIAQLAAMSSRQLRKLQQQRDLQKTRESTGDVVEESEDDEVPTAVSKPRPNLFAALGGEGEEEDASQSEDEAEAEPDLSRSQPGASGGGNKAKKQKRKSKKKKKNKKTEEDEAPGEEEDEIDKALQELRIDAQSNETATTSPTSLPTNDLLAVNAYHLRVLNEMTNIFGKEVIEASRREELAASHRRPHNNGAEGMDIEQYLRLAQGPSKLSELSLRRNLFVQGWDSWPGKSSDGLMMKEMGKAADGSWTEYGFVHAKEYVSVQQMFLSTIHVLDHMNMVHLLQRHPYHISTLLQVSLMAKMEQNMAFSAELRERALFSFGRVATASFKRDMERGCARMEFGRSENRQFWLAGYFYIQTLVRKGTFRTALEWARLLYSLDPADPYAMRNHIHGLAIRAHESRWLVDFLNYLDQRDDMPDVVYIRQTLVLASLQMGDIEGARARVKQGIERLPWLYCSLFQELKLDAPPSIWGIGPESDERLFWTSLYIHQTKDLWNNSQATTLLKDVTKDMDRVDLSTLPSHDAPVDRAVSRLCLLEQEVALISLAPRVFTKSRHLYDWDPLPPLEEEDDYMTTQDPALPWMPGGLNGGDEDDELMAQETPDVLMRRQMEMAAARVGGNDAEEEGEEEEEAMRIFGRGREGEMEERTGNGQRGRRMAGEEDSRARRFEVLDLVGLPGAWPAEEAEEDS